MDFLFQANCDLTGEQLISFSQKVIEGTTSIEKANDTYIVPILKIERPKKTQQFRPIGLCKCYLQGDYKDLISKIKSMLPKLAAPNQGSFVPGHYIMENIIVAQEVIHSVRGLKGRQEFMAVKVDLEKAYDCLNWKFLEDTLVDIRFLPKFIQTVIPCVTEANMQVLWGGSKTSYFKPQREGPPRGSLIPIPLCHLSKETSSSCLL